MRLLPRVRVFAAPLLFVALASAQGPEPWTTATELPGVDMAGLSPIQQTTVLKILRDQGCSCGCGMQIAECRVKDPPCSYSSGLAAMVVKGVRDGKTREQILEALKSSPLAKGPVPPPILSDPVAVPINGAPSKGPSNAHITLVEFSDFECPYCSHAVGQVEALLKLFPNDIRLVYKQFPLSMHPHARKAAAAALAANDQGKFWQMHDKLFANFRQLSDEHINALAKEIGLDMTRFSADLASGKYDKVINADFKDGEEAGVMGTPAFFINGKLYNGPMEAAQVKPLIEAELKGQRVAAAGR